MTKTVVITGASSGIGRETARLFLAKGWSVVATMRHPERDTALEPSPRLVKLALDVVDETSIEAVRAEVERRFGRIDALVNNAGYGLVGIFESMPLEKVARQFDTNVFGLMRVTQAFLPLMRRQREGVVVNVSSVGGRTTIPLYSAYHASKYAVEGFSESLQYELRPLGIRVKLIEPGAVRTDFVGRSSDVDETAIVDYADYAAKTLARLTEEGEKGIPPAVVAKAIYEAATEGDGRLRHVVGMQAKTFLGLRALLPHRLYSWLVARTFAA